MSGADVGERSGDARDVGNAFRVFFTCLFDVFVGLFPLAVTVFISPFV